MESKNPDCQIYCQDHSLLKPSEIHNLSTRLKSKNFNFLKVDPILDSLRLRKDRCEIELMEKAATISAEAMCDVISRTRPGMLESQLAANFEFHCKMAGAQRLAYPPIVATGINCNILHYVANDQLIEDGELVLMDAACEFWNYASDITRTFPANGKFSEAQLQIYNAGNQFPNRNMAEFSCFFFFDISDSFESE